MSAASDNSGGLFGVMAEFASPDELISAAQKSKEAGYTEMDGYSPFPLEDLTEALGIKPTKLPGLVLLGGIAGMLGGLGLLLWVNLIEYPLNIGGRPLWGGPSFVPITFECTILLAGLTAGIAMLALNGFPSPYHPVFNVPQFEKASKDGFFLCLEASDPQFEVSKAKAFLQGLGAQGVYEVAS